MLKIYGSLLCPDCIRCKEDLTTAGVAFTYLDFSKNLLWLKEFLQMRDQEPVFEEVRSAGKIGIPCIVAEDGTVHLSWEQFM
jgi:glutaredoxin-related protein